MEHQKHPAPVFLALDVTIQEQILQLLKNLKQKLGITIILISHDISVVKYLSERILVMLDGEIVESGDTISTLQNPKKEYTKKLIDAIPEGKLDDIKKHVKKRDAKINKQEV